MQISAPLTYRASTRRPSFSRAAFSCSRAATRSYARVCMSASFPTAASFIKCSALTTWPCAKSTKIEKANILIIFQI